MVLVINIPLANAGDIRDMGLILRLVRSPEGGHGNPLQYSCLENPMDRGAWGIQYIGLQKSQLWLNRLNTHIYMYMYMWVCMYVWVYIYVCTYMHICICIYIYVYMYNVGLWKYHLLTWSSVIIIKSPMEVKCLWEMKTKIPMKIWFALLSYGLWNILTCNTGLNVNEGL